MCFSVYLVHMHLFFSVHTIQPFPNLQQAQTLRLLSIVEAEPTCTEHYAAAKSTNQTPALLSQDVFKAVNIATGEFLVFAATAELLAMWPPDINVSFLLRTGTAGFGARLWEAKLGQLSDQLVFLV